MWHALCLVALVTLVPTEWSNCDAGIDRLRVNAALRTMDRHARWDQHRPSRWFAFGGRMGQIVWPGLTREVLNVRPRGVTTGAVTIDASATGGVELFLVCPTWLTENPPKTLTVVLDRSYDGGQTWQPYAETTFTSGAAPVTPFSRPDGMPYLRASMDGITSIWRWTITPSESFRWGVSATF